MVTYTMSGVSSESQNSHGDSVVRCPLEITLGEYLSLKKTLGFSFKKHFGRPGRHKEIAVPDSYPPGTANLDAGESVESQ